MEVREEEDLAEEGDLAEAHITIEVVVVDVEAAVTTPTTITEQQTCLYESCTDPLVFFSLFFFFFFFFPLFPFFVLVGYTVLSNVI